MGIDSGPLVPVSYGDLRADIAASFAGFSNGNNSGGAYYIDTTELSNGMHQIGWLVTDNCGRQDGIGSRFFTVLNGSSDAATTLAADARTTPAREGEQVEARKPAGAGRRVEGSEPAGTGRRVEGSEPLGAAASAADGARGVPREAAGRHATAAEGPSPVINSSAPIAVRHLAGDWQTVPPNADGWHVMEVPQGGRIEVQLPLLAGGPYEGVHDVMGQRRALPLGSSLDAQSGIFYWQPAAGFLGAYDLAFAPAAGGGAATSVRVVVGPSMRTTVDTSQGEAMVEQPFVVSGWALDLAATDGTGVDAVHVWAYPTTGTEPIFLGIAAYGDARPDVGAAHGARFRDAAYSLVVVQLAPGSYDVVVYPHRAKTNSFDGAQKVRVVVR